MSFIELIGFIVSLLMLIFLAGRQSLNERRKKRNPEQFREMELERERALKQFMREMNMVPPDELEEENYIEDRESDFEEFSEPEITQQVSISPKKPNTHRNVGKEYEFHGNLEQYQPKTPFDAYHLDSLVEHRYDIQQNDLAGADFIGGAEENPYEIKQEVNVSKIYTLLKRVKSKGNIILLREALGPPRAYKPYESEKR